LGDTGELYYNRCKSVLGHPGGLPTGTSLHGKFCQPSRGVQLAKTDTLHKATSHLARDAKSVWLILFILIFLAGLHPLTLVHAQTPTPRFTHLTSEQGLSHNAVKCILQDSQGFMWFGTQDGLNRYDGYTFTVYRHLRSDPNSLSNSTITALYQDRSGTLWIGTVMGLDSFAGGAASFIHYPAVAEQVGAIYEDATGILWIGTAGSGLFRYDRAAGQFTQYTHDPANSNSLSDDDVMAIYEDSSGTLWVGTAYGGLNAFDRATERFTRYHHDSADPHSLSYDQVTTIYEDDSGVLWVGTGSYYEVEVGGLNVFDRTPGHASEGGAYASERGTFTRYLHDPHNPHSLSNNHVRAIYEDQTGILWIGTDDGLNIFDRTTDSFVGYHHDPLNPRSLGDSPITVIYEDRAGTLWFGTDGAGVSKYARVKEKFARYQPDPLDPNSLSGAEVGALDEDHTVTLWIGIQGGGLDSLNRATGRFTHYSHDPDDPHSLGHDHVKALYEDHEGVLWVGTNQGLDRLDRATGQFWHYVHDPDDPSSLSPGAVKAILEDHTHTLWIATEEPGTLNRFDRTTEHASEGGAYASERGAFTRYEYDPANPDGFINTYGVRAIYEDRAGDLWLGTYNGLVHFDRTTEKFTRYRHDPDDVHSLSHDFVWSIYEDPGGTLWIATAGGLNRFDRATGRFTVYTIEDGLANDNVMGILADGQGNLWLGTDGGLSRFDPQTETFRNYDVSDGLVSNEIMLGALHQSKSGEMFFGTLDGFNAFYPAKVKDNAHIPPIVLTAFRKFDEVVELDAPLSEAEEITLSYKDNFFAFEFAALDYTDSAKNQYAYQLEGFDEDWIYCGPRRYASYTNLPPGEYTFRVKGSNNDGIWNETGRVLGITITPPFWQTWWFRGLAAAIVLGVASAALGARMRYVAVLRESEERFRALFENAPLCVFELDVTQTPPRIIHANRQSERVYGWATTEFTAVSLDSIFSPAARPTLERMIKTLSAGETLTVESTGLRRDGLMFPVRVSATGELGHDLRRAILAIEDITVEKERRSEEEAIAEERRRIAREIHDGLAQDLAGLRFEVGLWHKLVDEDPARMHAELDNLQEWLSKNIREVRRSIFALRPVALDELGFYPALRQFIGEFGEQNQLHLDLRIAGPPERLPAFLEPVLFRLIQESLNNVGKHAQASMVWIELDLESPDVVTLRVRDDGVGLNPALLDQIVPGGHLGLKQMRERAENLKGRFELLSQPGGGTEIRVVLPLTSR
jgi:PAS domain S-box-containing protein